ncbi:MAG: T9SS type A sorting domain-containing protein [Chitinophagales bacterium]|nr:T9SS type A sorting domain-containing protein [Chitinophagales bacterium]
MKSLLLCITILFSASLFAGPGDTIHVQTFTFGSPQDAWFVMPAQNIDIEKILMKYTLKCNPAQSPACGEWDYLTYTYLFEHTGENDSTLLTHPNYLANGISPDTFAYSTIPTFTSLPHWEYFILYDDTASYSEIQAGDGTDAYSHPFAASNPLGRTQILWTAEELTTAGLTAGDITGLQMNLNEAGSGLDGTKIKFKHTLITELNAATYETSGFTEVYHADIVFAGTGWRGFDFTTPFVWDGVSNILIEITYDNADYGANSTVEGHTTDYNSVMHINSDDRYVQFNNPDYASTTGNPLNVLNDAVTISYWAFGDPALQPQDGTCFEAVNEDMGRVLNVHAPWSDQNIYWDAGNDAGFDRINKVASAADYENTWTHWAFTKNATTGSMKIYKNGVLWHSGTGKIKPMAGIDLLWLGKGTWGGSQSYAGNMNEFAVWNAELDETTITNYLYKDLDDAHPFADNLLLYYHFNDGDGIYESDASVSDADLALIGATTKLFGAENLIRNLQFVNMRPNIRFEQGVYTAHLDSVLIIEEIENEPITLIIFNEEDPTIGIDTLLVFPGNYYDYIYDETGNIIDSNYVATTSEIYHADYTYYSEPFEVINRYELARYITPYGIGLDLGEGFTWTYDLSDYRPLLHDSVHLNAGNWQELLDVEFLFIEGTPPRKPTSVTNLWNGGFSYGLTPSYDDQTPDRTITIPATALNTRIISRVTGHGFGGTANCAEFCKKDHYIFVNGVEQWNREVWRENCDVNPVYPQGGTWVYDRANWCPGAEVETYHFELTPYVTPGGEVTLDYDAESYTWNNAGSVPYYQTEVQLITYEAPNFMNDAAVEDIIAPNTNQMWGRKNPVCNNPIIKIKNTGTETLTSLKIEYGIKDFDKAYYNWTGELAFLEIEEITLPDFPWSNSATAFEVTVREPNGVSDEYTWNDHAESKMQVPDVYPSKIIMDMRTNASPGENDLYIYDGLGNGIFARTTFAASTIYRDTLELADGCYELYLWDTDEDGLSWWANGDGSGYFKIKDGYELTFIETFEPDFGGLIYKQFTVGNYTDINDVTDHQATLLIYPNPAQTEFFVSLKMASQSDVHIQIFDVNGKLMEERQLTNTTSGFIKFNSTQYADGMYVLSANVNGEMMTKTFVIDK